MTKEQLLIDESSLGIWCYDDTTKTLWVYTSCGWKNTGVTWEQYSNMEGLKEKMTKQEKIREGIRELIKPYIKDEPWKPETLFVLSYRICELLHSRGVVIRVEGELPTYPCECCKHEDIKADDNFCFVREDCGEDYEKWELADYAAVESLLEDNVVMDDEPDCDGTVNCVPYKKGERLDTGRERGV